MDASVAAKWHLRDEMNVPEALSLLEGFRADAFALAAPYHIRYEVLNAITFAVQRARLTDGEAMSAAGEFLALELTTFIGAELLTYAYHLARQYRCAFYDALYLALAQQLERPLVTADRRLYNLVGHLPLVLWSADYAAL